MNEGRDDNRPQWSLCLEYAGTWSPVAMPVLTHLTSEKSAGRSAGRGSRRSPQAGTRRGACSACPAAGPLRLAPVAPGVEAAWAEDPRGRRLPPAVGRAGLGRALSPDRRRDAVGGAIGMLMGEVDARGFEVVVPRPIRRDEVLRVRTPSQVIGWRYHPEPTATGRPAPAGSASPRGRSSRGGCGTGSTPRGRIIDAGDRTSWGNG